MYYRCKQRDRCGGCKAGVEAGKSEAGCGDCVREVNEYVAFSHLSYQDSDGNPEGLADLQDGEVGLSIQVDEMAGGKCRLVSDGRWACRVRCGAWP